MSVTQLLSLRCKCLGAYLSSAAANASSVCTTTRYIFPAICVVPFSTCKKTLLINQNTKLRVKGTEQDVINYFLSPINANSIYQPNSSSHQSLLPFSIKRQDNDKIRTVNGWLPINHGLSYSISEPQVCNTNKNASSHKIGVNNFSSTQVKGEGQKATNSNGLPSEETLQRVAAILTKDLTGIFVQRPDYRIYRHDIILENRIHNKVVSGGLNYVKQMSFLKIYGHLRFVFVQLSVRGIQISTDEGVVRIRFCIKGFGVLKIFLSYLSKQLYKKENMSKHAPIWMEAVSTYHVDNEGKIFRHVLDNKQEDKESEQVKSTVQKVKEKLQKLGEKAPVPSPAL